MIDVTQDLPLRARRLDQDAVAAIFGGAKGLGQECTKDTECGTGVCDKPYRTTYSYAGMGPVSHSGGGLAPKRCVSHRHSGGGGGSM